MSKFTAMCLGVLTVASVLGIAIHACCGWTAEPDTDFRDVPAFIDQFTAEQERAMEFNRRERILRFRIAGRMQVVQELADGRLSLVQAAARFEALNTSPPDWPVPNSRLPEGKTHQEQLCRQVIDWTSNSLHAAAPERAAAVAERLKIELRGLEWYDGISLAH